MESGIESKYNTAEIGGCKKAAPFSCTQKLR